MMCNVKLQKLLCSGIPAVDWSAGGPPSHVRAGVRAQGVVTTCNNCCRLLLDMCENGKVEIRGFRSYRPVRYEGTPIIQTHTSCPALLLFYPRPIAEPLSNRQRKVNLSYVRTLHLAGNMSQEYSLCVTSQRVLDQVGWDPIA
nr:hypothetical protein CFP56_70124 [Quercus suber]